MRRARFIAAAAAVFVLALPTVALGQAGKVTLREQDSGFPDRAYLLQLPTQRTLTREQLTVTENGGPVAGPIGVEPPGSGTSGVILLIDASESMKGKPIEQAMEAARAFMKARNPKLPVAVMVYNPEQHVLTDFTTDAATLSEAVATTPEVVFGTEIYDSVIHASEMATDYGLTRSTAVLLSDGQELSSESGFADALAALDEASMRVIAVGFQSRRYQPKRLNALATGSGGAFIPGATSDEFVPVFQSIGRQLSSEYLVTYRSILPEKTKATVSATVAGLAPATATYTTPELAITEGGTFDRSRVDDVILSPYLMIFIIVAVVALLIFAVLSAVDVRSRSVRRRMSRYVNVPSEDESRMRRAEVKAMLAERAQRRVEGNRWWQSFERDVELAGFSRSAVTLAGWTVIGGVLASIVAALVFQSLFGLLVGLLAPLVTRAIVKNRIQRKRSAFAEELPDNLEVLAGALRAGHSLIGAMGVMVDGATEPSKTEFRRVLQDEQLGVPLDEALMVMARRMDNLDIEQVAIVTRLGREAGGNTAEVLDRVVENIRGRMELKRLVRVLTAQGRIARYILTGIPVVLLGFFFWVNPTWLEPLWTTPVGQFAFASWFIMLIAGWFAIKKIVDIEV